MHFNYNRNYKAGSAAVVRSYPKIQKINKKNCYLKLKHKQIRSDFIIEADDIKTVIRAKLMLVYKFESC